MEHVEPDTSSGMWLDWPGAAGRIDRDAPTDELARIAHSLREDGIAVLRRAHAPELCHAVIAEYQRYVEENRAYVESNLDSLGREKRLVNFHLWSPKAAEIGTASAVMRVLDFIFGRPAAVYTSLTFKFGTQQPVHRDTPHFATWPRNMFVGVWTALERVSSDAGPLFYHRGAHRFEIDPIRFMNEANAREPDSPLQQRLLLALDLYNGEVIRRAPVISPPTILDLDIGDTVIWHPQLPHGGSPALEPMRTRWSIVFHCAPVDVQVHQHDRFFTHVQSAAPPDRYGYRHFADRKIAVSGETAFM